MSRLPLLLLASVLALPGCMTMDSFFFNATKLDAYALESDVIPQEDLELVDFTSGDGTQLYGLWAHQPDAGAQVVVYFHGNEGNMDEYMRQTANFWSMGYEEFTFDYRGYGMSEGTPDLAGIIADGEAAIGFVTDATGLATSDIAYHGLSLGGAVAVHDAVDLPPKVLITEDMFASGQHLINTGSGLDLPDGWLLADEWDNAAAAHDVHVPYLVMHGDSDTFIEPTNADEVYAAANDPKKLWFVAGSDHAEDDLTDPEGYVQNVTCWIDQSCPAE